MDISRFSERAPSRDDLLASLGLETRRSVGTVLARDLGLLAVGLLAGAGLTLLLSSRGNGDARAHASGRRAADRREAGDGPTRASSPN